jgi:hypothetical protein
MHVGSVSTSHNVAVAVAAATNKNFKRSMAGACRPSGVEGSPQVQVGVFSEGKEKREK